MQINHDGVVGEKIQCYLDHILASNLDCTVHLVENLLGKCWECTEAFVNLVYDWTHMHFDEFGVDSGGLSLCYSRHNFWVFLSHVFVD
jgi:hypothetical protein